VWSTPRPGHFTPGEDPVPIVYEVGWAPGPVWRGAENLDLTGIRSPEYPINSESLHRLSYAGPLHLAQYAIKLSQTISHVRWLKGKQRNVFGTSWRHRENEFTLVARSSFIAFGRREGVRLSKSVSSKDKVSGTTDTQNTWI
jgi:hypothetical protein